MATSRKMNLGKTKKTKPVKNMSTLNSVVKGTADILIPRTVEDWAWTLGGGKAFQLGKRAVGGITKKGAKFVGKTYRNMSK